MAFYARPTTLISPGDIFPDIPITISIPPPKILRKSPFNPPAKFAHHDLRRVFTLPQDAAELNKSQMNTKAGEETLAATRTGMAMFLSWGSQVEADERELLGKGKAQRKGWLAAPIFRLQEIPENAVIEDPKTGQQVSIREVVRNNLSHNYFYLPQFPERIDTNEYYVDFRKICAVGIKFFIDSKGERIATLSESSLNSLFSRLMWFFTRAEYFFKPIACPTCKTEVPVDIRFEGQNFDAEPWE
jgi:hypothetical protein